MGFCMVRGPDGTGLACVHPNALNHSWDLKQGAPLKNPRAQHQGYVTAIITGALAAGAPWCTTWAGQLLSVSAWCQVAILSGYEHKCVARWAHSTSVHMHARHTHPRRLRATSTNTLNFSRDGGVVMFGLSSNGCRQMSSGKGHGTQAGACLNGFHQMVSQGRGAKTGQQCASSGTCPAVTVPIVPL